MADGDPTGRLPIDPDGLVPSESAFDGFHRYAGRPPAARQGSPSLQAPITDASARFGAVPNLFESTIEGGPAVTAALSARPNLTETDGPVLVARPEGSWHLCSLC